MDCRRDDVVWDFIHAVWNASAGGQKSHRQKLGYQLRGARVMGTIIDNDSKHMRALWSTVEQCRRIEYPAASPQQRQKGWDQKRQHLLHHLSFAEIDK